ncbi:hypothetical protein ACEPPN_000324 [Leptodophora sp. 'Broadleaf-Isolate-01']
MSTSVIEDAHAAQLAIDAPINLPGICEDEYYAWMTDPKDTVPASGDDFDMIGQFEGGMADDAFSWLMFPPEMDVASADENICFVEGMGMGITATKGAADTMNDSSTSKDSPVDAAPSQGLPASTLLSEDATSAGSPPNTRLPDVTTNQASPASTPPPEDSANQESSDKAMSQGSPSSSLAGGHATSADSPPSVRLPEDATNQALPTNPPPPEDLTNQESSDNAMRQGSPSNPSSQSRPERETTSPCCIHCSTARGNIRTPIVINDPDDERATEIPNYIRAIVGSDILDEEMGSEYGGEIVDDLQPRGFNRASRRQGAMNQLRDAHVGFTIKVLERLIVQVQARDDGEGKEKRFRKKEDCLLSELKATDATLGVMNWLAASDIQRYRVKLHRARRQRKNSEMV